MISKGCLVRFKNGQYDGRLFLTISDPYDWTGADWQGEGVVMYDPTVHLGQKLAAIDLLELVSQ